MLLDESLYYFFLIVKERQPIWFYSHRSDWLNRQCEMFCITSAERCALKIGGG